MPGLSDDRLEQLLASGQAGLLAGGLKGIEKESLRVAQDGSIARTPHPTALGAALTHPYITTDYSEALLELITPAYPDLRDMLSCLCAIHQFVYSNIGEELLWATSMPCRVGDDESIPIAQYGSSNVGTMKYVYRRGLGYRYGRTMQTISGIHFNYSVPEAFWPVWQALQNDRRDLQDFVSDCYFGLVRNFQRFGWLIPFLFGASPAICRSFMGGREHSLQSLSDGTLYLPYATSLRMSDIGYKNDTQANLHISYDTLDDYVGGLTGAIETSYPRYEDIGTVVDGEYRQLNTNMLQIENEFYSFVRPKQVANSGEKPTLALKRRGVRYLEVRALDVDAYQPVGVGESELRFVEAFLVFCLMQPSPRVDASEREQIDKNQREVAGCGRDPALELVIGGKKQGVTDWVKAICTAMTGVCETLDSAEGHRLYSQALAEQQRLADDPGAVPSARMLMELQDQQESFFDFAMRKSHEHRRYFGERPLDAERRDDFERAARASLEEQQRIERSDNVSFEEYLERYFSQA